MAFKQLSTGSPSRSFMGARWTKTEHVQLATLNGQERIAARLKDLTRVTSVTALLAAAMKAILVSS
jgi:hypothetical protein